MRERDPPLLTLLLALTPSLRLSRHASPHNRRGRRGSERATGARGEEGEQRSTVIASPRFFGEGRRRQAVLERRGGREGVGRVQRIENKY